MNIEEIQLTKEVEELLVREDLPTSDLTTATKLFGLRLNNALVGVVGIEQEGKVALLRSLVVNSDVRSDGYGKQLVRYAESWSSENGIRQLYLLTTTAANYFLKLGFKNIPRDEAPAFIVNTSQFSDLCPSSADFMCKTTY